MLRASTLRRLLTRFGRITRVVISFRSLFWRSWCILVVGNYR